MSIFATGCDLTLDDIEEWLEENVNLWTPEPEVKSPRAGSRPVLGEEITFKGSAWDLETGLLSVFDGNIQASDFYLKGDRMVWASDKDGRLGTGEQIKVTLDTAGMHEISLTATDNENDNQKSGKVTFNLYVLAEEPDPNTEPVATILAPTADERIYTVGDSVTFEGQGSDLEQGMLSGEHLVWTSDIDGTLGTGNAFSTDSLSEGSHTITLFALEKTEAEAADGEAGLAGTAIITVLVNGEDPPNVSIDSPEDGAVFEVDQTITFTGSASYSNGGSLDSEDQMVWESSIDGPLDKGASIETTLSEGVHVITLTVKESDEDNGEAKGADQITVSVVAPPEEPVAGITSPNNGTVFVEGDTVVLEGYGTDAAGESMTGDSLIWTIDDEEVGTGTGPIELTDIAVGTHAVTLKAENADGTGIAVVSISVVEAEVEVVPGIVKGAVKAADTQMPLGDVAITIVDAAGETVAEGASDASGLFVLEAPETTDDSTYSIAFEADEYEPGAYHGLVVVGEETTQIQTVYLTPITPETGSVSGQVIDAMTGHGVEGLTLNVRAGLNNLEGETIISITTMDMGAYEIGDLTAGQYTAEIEAAEISGVQYTASSFTITCVGGVLTPNQNGTVTPVMPEGEYRIILTWGEMPRDLDSHLAGPTVDGEHFHLYYTMSEMNSGSQWPEDVTLDLDDTTRYGPETTTIFRLNPGEPYVFYVHDYTNNYVENSSELAESDAKVEVYMGSTLVKTYHVPQGTTGTLWTVFQIDPSTGAPTEVGTMSNAQSPSQIGAPTAMPSASK